MCAPLQLSSLLVSVENTISVLPTAAVQHDQDGHMHALGIMAQHCNLACARVPDGLV